jgi:hypothetical protein
MQLVAAADVEAGPVSPVRCLHGQSQGGWGCPEPCEENDRRGMARVRENCQAVETSQVSGELERDRLRFGECVTVHAFYIS